MEQHEAMDDQSRPSGGSGLPMWQRAGFLLVYALVAVPVLVQVIEIGERYFGWQIAPHWRDLFRYAVNGEMVLLLLVAFVGSVLFILYGHRLQWQSRFLLWITRALCGFLVLLLLFEFMYAAVNGHPANLSQVFRDL